MNPMSRRRTRLGRPPLAVVLPFILFVLAAAGWSAVWYEGSRRAEAMIGDLLAAQAAAGRSLDCAERSVGGYPFRFEVTCHAPRLAIADGHRLINAAATRLSAVAMVWGLNHLIVEAEGPLLVETGGDSVEGEWSLLQSSIRLSGHRPYQVAVVADDAWISADSTLLGPSGALVLSADRLELHQRQEPEAPDMDVGLNASGLVLTSPGGATAQAVDIAMVGRLLGLPTPLPRQADDFLAAWRGNNGAVEIVDLRVMQAETVLRAEGQLTPDARGRPEGRVTVSLAGADATSPGTDGAFGGIVPMLTTVLRTAGRAAEIDGRDAVAGDLRLEDGRVYFGPLPIAVLPPLL